MGCRFVVEIKKGAKCAHLNNIIFLFVGAAGFEPTTSAARSLRATKLRYAPVDKMESKRYTHPSQGRVFKQVQRDEE
jgi:hypothetical protein